MAAPQPVIFIGRVRRSRNKARFEEPETSPRMSGEASSPACVLGGVAVAPRGCSEASGAQRGAGSPPRASRRHDVQDVLRQLGDVGSKALALAIARIPAVQASAFPPTSTGVLSGPSTSLPVTEVATESLSPDLCGRIGRPEYSETLTAGMVESVRHRGLKILRA